MGSETCVYKTFVAKTSLKKVDKDYEKAEDECRELRNRIYAIIAAGPQPPYKRWPWSRPVTWPEYVSKELRKLFDEYEMKLERTIDLANIISYREMDKTWSPEFGHLTESKGGVIIPMWFCCGVMPNSVEGSISRSERIIERYKDDFVGNAASSDKSDLEDVKFALDDFYDELGSLVRYRKIKAAKDMSPDLVDGSD